MRSDEYDLRDRGMVQDLYVKADPDVVINIAAAAGGIGACSANPGKFFFDNLMMGMLMMEVGRTWNLDKFVQIGSICSYPGNAKVPIHEEYLWDGYPEVTNAPYGIAKRVLMTQCQAYREQYGMNAIGLMPVNLYGPHDSFDPDRSHAIPALIRKCVEAKETGGVVNVWGSGIATREFLYVEDCAEAILLAAERYDEPMPINLGTGHEILISDVLVYIAEMVGYKGEFVWDRSKPDGQLRRCLDVSRAKKKFGFEAKTDFLVGLKRTVEWYLDARKTNSL